MDDSGATHFVFQADKPGVEFLGSLKGVHTSHCIRLDTYMQSSVQGEWSRYERPNVVLCGRPTQAVDTARRWRPVRTSEWLSAPFDQMSLKCLQGEH